MKKPFYKLPDFIIRWWCKFFKCSKIASPEQEIDSETDWNKIADKMHENSRQDPDNPNITYVQWRPRKPMNKNKLVLDCLVHNFAYGWIKSEDVVRILIIEQNWDISKKDIWRIISNLRKKGVLKRYKCMDMNRRICSKYLFDKAVLNDLIRKDIVKKYRHDTLLNPNPEIRTCDFYMNEVKSDTCDMPGNMPNRSACDFYMNQVKADTCDFYMNQVKADTCDMPGNLPNGNNNSFSK